MEVWITTANPRPLPPKAIPYIDPKIGSAGK